MSTQRGRLRLAGIITGVLVIVGVGAALASPPRSAGLDEYDGRTWLPVERESGTHLLLVNGLSGLIEAEADLEQSVGPIRFADSTSEHTLFATGTGSLVVDDASHGAAVRPGYGAGGAVLVGGGALAIDRSNAELMPASLVGEPDRIPLPLPPVDGTSLVVDGRGRAWYLGATPDGGRAAVRLGDRAAEPRVVDLDPSTRRLLVVDGAVQATGDDAVRSVEGKASRSTTTPAGDRIDPTVAVGTGGLWASALGREVTTVTESAVQERQELPEAVAALAVWHGRVVAVTANGAFTGGMGQLLPIPEIGPGATLHVDGGLLWLSGRERSVAISPSHDRVVLEILNADLSLCVGDCSAAAASSFLEDVATAPLPAPGGPAAPATTQPPRKLEQAAVTPTLPNAPSKAPTISNAPVGAPDPEAAVPVAPAPADPAPPPPAVPAPPTTFDILGTTIPDDGSKKPGRPDPPGRSDDTTTTTATTTPPLITLPPPDTSPETTTTLAPEPLVDLEFDLRLRDGGVTAELRVVGRPEQCGSSGTSTVATLVWQGSATGTRQLEVAWPSEEAGASHLSRATITSPAGDLTVSVAVCGVTTSRTTSIPGSDPSPTTTTTHPPTTTTTSIRPPTTTTTIRPPTTTTTILPPTTTTILPPTTTTRPGSTTTTTRPAIATRSLTSPRSERILK